MIRGSVCRQKRQPGLACRTPQKITPTVGSCDGEGLSFILRRGFSAAAGADVAPEQSLLRTGFIPISVLRRVVATEWIDDAYDGLTCRVVTGRGSLRLKAKHCRENDKYLIYFGVAFGSAPVICSVWIPTVDVPA